MITLLAKSYIFLRGESKKDIDVLSVGERVPPR